MHEPDIGDSSNNSGKTSSRLAESVGAEDEVRNAGLTSEEVNGLRQAKLARIAARAITQDDLLAELSRLSAREGANVHRQLAMRSNAPLPAVARGVRMMLTRTTETEACRILHDCFHSGVLVTAETADLSDEELAALLNGELDGLNLDPGDNLLQDLRDVEKFGVTPATRAAAWSAMVSRGHGGDIAALAWLVADPPTGWSDTHRAAVAQAWASVRARNPLLPENPLTVDELVELANEIVDDDVSTSPPSVLAAPTDADASEGETTAELDRGGTGEDDLDRLRIEVDALDRLRADVAERDLPALARIVEDATVGTGQTLSRLVEYFQRLSQLADAVSASVGPGGPGTLSTLAGLRDTVDTAIAARSTNALLDRVRRLTTLRAPSYAEPDARRIAELAGSVDQHTEPALLAALDALVTLIDLGGSDPAQDIELGRVVSSALPNTLSLLMLASKPGTLQFASGVAITTSSREPDRAHTAEADGEPTATTLTTAPSAGIEVAVTNTSPHQKDNNAPATSEPTPAMGATNQAAAAGTPTGTDEPEQAETPAAVEPDLAEVLAGLDLTIPAPVVPRSPQTRPTTRSAAGIVAAEAHATSGESGATPDNACPQTTDPVELRIALLDNDQFALAYWLAVAQDAPPAMQAAYRLAAHATAIKTSTGANAAAFAETVNALNPDELHDHLGAQMLVYAAAVRAGLLSPTAGAVGPLRDIATSVVRTSSAVGQLTDVLLTGIYNGAYLTPRSADTLADPAEAGSDLDALPVAASEMLANGAARTIKYQAATQLWQNWVSPEGYLGRPLAIVAAGSTTAADLALVRERVAELRSRTILDTAVDRDAPRLQTKRTRRIEARARSKILDWAGEVAELLSRWITAVEDYTRPGNRGTWMTDPITNLRGKVAAVRDHALADLADVSDSGLPARRAALDAGLRILTDALDLLAGTAAVTGPELSAERILGGPLVLAANLPLTTSMQPLRPVTVGDIATAGAAWRGGTANWQAAYEQRAARHDHVGTLLILDMLRGVDPKLSQQLRATRDQAVDESTRLLDETVAVITRRIDADRRFGRLSDDDWVDLSTLARAYQPSSRGPRNDFDRMLTELEAIETDRHESADKTVAAYRAKIDTSTMSGEDADRVMRCVDDGDLSTAAEYVETLSAGHRLPGPEQQVDHLELFATTFPALFGRQRPAVGAHPLLGELHDLLDSGTSPPQGPLADALAAAGIDLTAMPRGKTSATRIESWQQLSDGSTLEARIGKVKAVLEQAGFRFDKSTTPPTRRGQGGRRGISWLDLHGVTNTVGKALIPAFGTGMSPSGDSLRLLAVWRSPTPHELVELLRNEPPDQSVIVLYFGTLDPTARHELAEQFRSGRKLPTAAVIDDAAFAYLACQQLASRETTMAITLPYTAATPFTPDVPGVNIPQEMFYGRAEERDKVVNMMGPCVVYGGRQLGKSALLRAAEREFDNGRTKHALYESIFKIGRAQPVDAVWTTLWPLLASKAIIPAEAPIPAMDVAGALSRHVSDWIAGRPGRQLLLLLDECDAFLDQDAAATSGRFTHVTLFKELMERTDRAVKVVFAGLHQTARFERLSNNPLPHLGDPVRVGPLAPQAAYDLFTKPLHALGYRFAGPGVAARVLALANNQPALIQLFGARLLRNLASAPLLATAPPQVIARDDIEQVWQDPALRTSFRKRFDWTLDLDPHYKVIAYCVAQNAHAFGIDATMSATELRAECETWWPAGFAAKDIRTSEFRALLDECVDLGVLSRTTRGYRLRTPNVLDLLGSREDVDEVLAQAKTLDLPESFDGSLLRPVFGDGPTRGPLTSQQLADLLAARNQVRLIAGSQALTVQRTPKVVETENEHPVGARRKAYLRYATPTTLVTATRQAVLRAASGHALIIVDLRDTSVEAATAVWHQARELIAVGREAGGTLGIVLISTPAQAPLWPAAALDVDTSAGLTELRRYGTTDLRLWMTETHLPFQDTASRAELLATAGGWPVLLNRVAEELDVRGDQGNPGDALEWLRAYLADPTHAAGLVSDSGVRVDATLSAAWDFLVQLVDAPADLQTLADYVEMHAESGEQAAVPLHPHRLLEAGYGSALEVVEVLRTLGVLIPAGDGTLFVVEPVMAAATRLEQQG